MLLILSYLDFLCEIANAFVTKKTCDTEIYEHLKICRFYCR